jgi:hypothetical protein
VEARHVLQFFDDNRNDPAYWDTQHDPFTRGPFDPDLSAVIERKKAVPPKEFDVAAALISAAKNLDADTVAKLATIPAETYRDLIPPHEGIICARWCCLPWNLDGLAMPGKT